MMNFSRSNARCHFTETVNAKVTSLFININYICEGKSTQVCGKQKMCSDRISSMDCIEGFLFVCFFKEVG